MSRNPEEPVYNLIEVARVALGLTRQELADKVGVHYQTIGYLEREEYSPSLVLALRIANATGVARHCAASSIAASTASTRYWHRPRRCRRRCVTVGLPLNRRRFCRWHRTWPRRCASATPLPAGLCNRAPPLSPMPRAASSAR